jgi:hypothetical protein
VKNNITYFFIHFNMAQQQSILVLGAGELGGQILHSLSQHPQRNNAAVTVLLRQSTIDSTDPAKVTLRGQIAAGNISLLAGDIDAESIDSLAAKFAHFTVIIGATGMAASSGIQVKLGRAVLQAKVPRYLPWQFGVNYDIIGPSSSQDLFTEQLDVRALLRGQSETRWVIVSTGMFTSFLFSPGFGVVLEDRRTVRALGGWENEVTVTAVEDIGRMVAEIVFVERETEGVVFVAGDTISYGQLADVVEKSIGESVEREEWTVPALKTKLATDPKNGTIKYQVVFAEGNGVAWKLDQTLNSRRGIHLKTVEEWLKDQN